MVTCVKSMLENGGELPIHAWLKAGLTPKDGYKAQFQDVSPRTANLLEGALSDFKGRCKSKRRAPMNPPEMSDFGGDKKRGRKTLRDSDEESESDDTIIVPDSQLY